MDYEMFQLSLPQIYNSICSAPVSHCGSHWGQQPTAEQEVEQEKFCQTWGSVANSASDLDQ